MASPYDALFDTKSTPKSSPYGALFKPAKVTPTSSYDQALQEAKKTPGFQQKVQKNLASQQSFEKMTPEQKDLLYPKAFLDLVKKVDDEEKLRSAQGIQPSYRPSSPIIPGLPSYSEIMKQKPIDVDMSKAYTTYPK
jgi:hypothetical protein